MSRLTLERLGTARQGTAGDVDAGGLDTSEWGTSGSRIQALTNEVRNWQELALTWRVNKETRDGLLLDLNANAGDFDLRVASDGTFTTVDRADGLNTFTFSPPSGRKDLRYVREYVVKDYNEKVIDQAGDRYEVAVKLVAKENKTPQDTYPTGLSRGPSEWKFEFSEGDVVTTRVKQNLVREGKEGVERAKLRIGMERSEAIVVEESVRALGAVTVRTIPDGDDIPKDYSTGEVNTVAVTSPDASEGAFRDGSYVVDNWETRWTNDEFFEVKLDMMKVL